MFFKEMLGIAGNDSNLVLNVSNIQNIGEILDHLISDVPPCPGRKFTVIVQLFSVPIYISFRWCH